MIAPAAPHAVHGAAEVLGALQRQARQAPTVVAVTAGRRRPLERLPRAPLDDALRICLGYLEEEPERFEPAAVVWHARWCMHAPELTFAEAISTLEAVQALRGPSATHAAHTLQILSDRHGLDEVAVVLAHWIAARDAGSASVHRPAGTEKASA